MKYPTLFDAYRFFHEGSVCFAEIEAEGISIDMLALDLALLEIKRRIQKKETKLRKTKVFHQWVQRFGDKTNIDSEAQLGVVLFDVLKMKAAGKTRTGKWKTDAAALEKVEHPFIRRFLELKKLKKLHSTYLTGLRREVYNGKLHTSFNLTSAGKEEDKKGGASSYRGSSSDPNFQNIPIRDPKVSGIIRPCFIARDGEHLIEIDFAQLEVRISACYNKDPVLMRYICDPTTDMHRDMACEIFLLKPEQVEKKTTRDAAKNQFVFPAFYGSYYKQYTKAIWERMERAKYKLPCGKLLKQHLKEKGITRCGECDPTKQPVKGTFEYHLKQVEDDFWNKRFKKYSQWKKDYYRKYLKRGKFKMYTGFECVEPYRRNQVLNFSVQGSGFHCLLWCIIKAHKEFKRKGMKTKIVGQIHDCILLSSPPKELQKALTIMHRIMTVDIRKEWKWINVPLEAEADVVPVGKSWNDKAPWILNNNKWMPKASKGNAA